MSDLSPCDLQRSIVIWEWDDDTYDVTVLDHSPPFNPLRQTTRVVDHGPIDRVRTMLDVVLPQARQQERPQS